MSNKTKVLIQQRDGFMRRMFKVWSSMFCASDCEPCIQQAFVDIGPDDALILHADRPLSRSQIESMKVALGLWRDGTNYPLILDGGLRVVGVRRSAGNK